MATLFGAAIDAISIGVVMFPLLLCAKHDRLSETYLINEESTMLCREVSSMADVRITVLCT
jgi:hypothetical protein